MNIFVLIFLVTANFRTDGLEFLTFYTFYEMNLKCEYVTVN